MQPGTTQVRVDNENSPVRLADNGLRQIGRDESFPLARNRTRNQHGPKRLIRADLIKPRPERAKLLRAMGAQARIEKNINIRVEMPLRMRAVRSQVIESQILARQRVKQSLLPKAYPQGSSRTSLASSERCQ